MCHYCLFTVEQRSSMFTWQPVEDVLRFCCFRPAQTAELSPQEKAPLTLLLSLSKMSMSSVIDDHRPAAFMNSDWMMRMMFTTNRRVFFQLEKYLPLFRWSQKMALSPKVNLQCVSSSPSSVREGHLTKQ